MDVYFQQVSSMATSCIIGVEYQNQEMDMGTVHNFTYTNGICICTCVFSSVQLLSVSDSLRPHILEHARLPCPSPTPGAYSNSCSSHQ